MFDRHNVSVTVKSAARGGTTACQWAKDVPNGDALNVAAHKLFPELKTAGPDFVWYTLGGNDLEDKPYIECSKKSKNNSANLKCLDEINEVITGCTDELLDSYWKLHPTSTVVQCGYDLPCEAGGCIPESRNPFCGTNVTCLNEGGLHFQKIMVDARVKRYNGSRPYIGLNVVGAVQAAGGVPGAAVGKPVLSVGSPCDLMSECVHPTYGKAGAVAVAEAFWDLYFKSVFEN